MVIKFLSINSESLVASKFNGGGTNFLSGTKEDMSRHRHQEIERQKENINNEKMKRTRNT